jgi:hypothetical protein
MYAAGVAADGWFNFALWPGLTDAASAGSNLVLCVERTRDTAGASTGDGLVVYFTISGQGVGGYYLDFTNNVAPSVTPQSTWQGATGIVGADTYLAPFFPPGQGVSGKQYPPALFGLVYYDADVTKGTNVAVTMYGASHTFKCMGSWSDKWAPLMTTGSFSANAVLAMRFE